MALFASIMGIILAFSSMWLGWYVLRIWPDLYEQAKHEHPELPIKDIKK
jgi:hypothetical protein